jgi:amino acid adenylation domain-containing protein
VSADNLEDLRELSAIQHGILFHSVWGREVYVEQMVCTLRGRLDVPAFERAWQGVVDAHDVLRTSFVWQGVERPLQVVQRRVALVLEQRDWTPSPPGTQAALLSAWLDGDRARGFDLARAPLLRLALLRTGADVHHLVWTHHHILLDGWSVGLVLEEVLARYEGERGGPPAELRRGVPFSAYLDWMERRGSGPAEAWWRRTLAGAREAIPLGGDAGCRPFGSGPVSEQRLTLTPDETAALHAAARRHRVTLGTLAHGAWAMLLARYSGEDECVFGTVTSTRPADLPGAASVVGPCFNTLPFRVAIPPGLSVGSWLQGLQTALVELRQHDHVGLADIHAWSGIPRGARLFESILAFENYPLATTLGGRGSSLAFTDVRWSGSTNYPLAAIVVPRAETTLCIQHDVSRYSAETTRAMLGHYRALLLGMTQPGNIPLRALTPLSADERELLLVGWNPTRTEAPAAGSLHPLFAAQVARTPAAVAVTYRGAALSYVELDRRANRLAWRLRARGVGPEVRVGLLVERGLDLLVGVLAIAEAGGAFVPLDPDHPPERVGWIVRDAQLALVVTQENLSGRLPPEVDRIGFDADDAASPGPLPSGVGPDHLAYVLYTSGSTGVPKGVMIPHRGLVNYLAWAARAYAVAEGVGAPVHTSVAFDLTFTALLVPLCAGRRVDLLVEERGVGALAAALRAPSDYSLVKLTPSHVEVLAGHALTPPSAPATRAFVVGGESLRPEHVRALRAAAPGAVVYNEYGPTEAVVGCCVHTVPDLVDEGGPLPIGRPIDNTRLYILDRDFAPVPVGVIGELFIGGAGLARGYLGQPGRTAERFVPDPFGDQPGSRLYRTGDRARRRVDGDIAFIGRMDEQVKVRGHRVEPAEIEAALTRHPAVAQAVVVTRARFEGAHELVACWVAAGPDAPGPGELRKHLLDKLPEPMVPARFVRVEHLPLTPNGKVDRAALAAAGGEGVAAASAPFVAPQSPTEESLARIWAEVLGVERISRDDDFFDLGGHSLSALRAVSRIRGSLHAGMALSSLFTARTLAALAAVVDSERLGAASPVAGGTTDGPVPRRSQRGAAPASLAQERLWVLDQLHPGVYHVSAAARLEGALDVGALEQALRAVVARHDILRARFVVSDGALVQVSGPASEAAAFVLERIPLGGQTPDARREEAREALTRALCRPFDLGTGPLLRAGIVTVDIHEHELLLAMHHLVCDGWSRDVLVRELALAYTAVLRADPVPPPALLVQYADYAAWQRARVDATEAAQLAWWVAQLEGIPPLDLPIARPRPPERRFRGAQHPIVLSTESVRALSTFCRAHRETPFTVLLSAFVALLHRYTGQDDIGVGTSVADRGRPELDALIGPFLNTIVVRGRPRASLPFRALAQAIGVTLRDAQAHADIPFGRVVRGLGAGQDPQRNPVFQALFDLQDAPDERIELPGVRLFPLRLDTGTAKLDLALHLWASREGFHGWIEYDTDLFEGVAIARMASHFDHLLRSIGGGEAPIGTLPILPPAERRQVLVTWNGPSVAYGGPEALHRLVEAQVARSPDAIAVVFEGDRLTYRELDQRADRLARRLVNAGVGPESIVGVHVDRSLALVVALLAILKAGGAWLPLDPDLPAERRASMIADAAPTIVLLADGGGAAPFGTATLYVSAAGDSATEGSAPLVATSPTNLAYVIYTSGSTGQPKGVQIQHDGICNRLAWMQAAYGLTPADRVLHKTPIGFDVSVWELFWPLITGARLVLARPGGQRDPRYLAQLIRDEGVTTVHFVPSLLAAFVDEPALSDCVSLARVFCSGEALSPDVAARFAARSEAALHNLYGPTEASVDVTAWTWRPGSTRVPIGSPIANIRIYILDPRLEPVPIGVPGELYIGGIGVARGYLGRPGLTADAFVPDPFAPSDGGRLYRTGDRARHLEDGAIEFLGRNDDQVKIRGVRIEPAEIEMELRRHAAVGACAVVARPHSAGGLRLTAYVVPRAGTMPPADVLRRHLAVRLPESMIPTGFVSVATLPRQPSGKVDRRALLALPAEQAFVARAALVTPPRSASEHGLARIWCAVLGVDRVGVHDNFFALGGDSIRGIAVVAQARAAGFDVTLRRLFNEPTIAALASLAPLPDTPLPDTPLPETAPRADAAEFPAPTAPFALLRPADRARGPAGIEDAYPLTALQLGMVFHASLESGSRVYRNVDSVHLRAPWAPELLRGAVQRLVDRHGILRTSFEVHTFEDAVQLVYERVEAPLVIEDLRGLTAEQQEAGLDAWLREQESRAFALGVPPLFGAHVHRRTDETFQFTLPHHHAILDGWSVSALCAELMTDYLSAVRAEAAPAPPIGATFRDYVALERTAVDSAEHQDYWHALLADAPTCVLPAAPAGRDEGAAVAPEHREHRVGLGAPLASALAGVAAAQGVPLKSVLLAAHLHVVRLLTHQSDVVTGLITDGRPELPGAERVLGLFLNTAPFRLRLGGGTWAELVNAVFHAEREALPYRRFPLARMGSGRRPSFDTAFNYTHFHVLAPLSGLDGLEVLERRSFALQTFRLMANFDLDAKDHTLTLVLGYDACALSDVRIEDVAACYARTLAEIAGDPHGQYAATGTAAVGDEAPGTASSRAPAASGHRQPTAAPPRTPIERVLAGIWSDLLHVDPIGIDEDFFELGGDSLVAIRVVSRLRDRARIELSPSALFEAPTIAALAARVEAGRPGTASRSIALVAHDGPTGLSLGQQPMFLLDAALRGLPLFHAPVRLHVAGLLDIAALRRSFAHVAERHGVLRTTFTMLDGRPVQRVLPAIELELPCVDLRALAEPARTVEAERLAWADAARPFDLAGGPPIRASLLRLGDKEHVLLLTLHHLVSDGWSMGVLAGEVAAAYAAFVSGAPPALPRLPLQYRDYVAWQAEQRKNGGFDAALAWWMDELAAPLPPFALGGAVPSPRMGGFRPVAIPVQVGRETTEGLTRVGRQEGASLFMVLLAAFDVVLHAVAGARDIRVGTLVANRTSSETEGLIGLFVNTLLLRVDLSGDPSFREILRAVRARTLAAYDRQDVPFEAVVHALEARASASGGSLDRATLFQAMFILQSAPIPTLELPGLVVESWERDAPPLMTSFDVKLVLEEVAGGLVGSLVYREAFVEETAMTTLLGLFEVLLEDVSGGSDEQLSTWRRYAQAGNTTDSASPLDDGQPAEDPPRAPVSSGPKNAGGTS